MVGGFVLQYTIVYCDQEGLEIRLCIVRQATTRPC